LRSCSASQGMYSPFTEPGDYCVHKNLPLVPVLNQMNPVNIPTILRSTFILCSHLHQGLPIDLFLSGCPNKILCAFPNVPMHAACHAHLILLDMITLIMCGKKYKIMKLLIVQFSPVFFPLRPKYSPQCCVLSIIF
jgi:hypothetical protein